MNWNYAGLWTTNKRLYFLSRFYPTILKWLYFLLLLLFAVFSKNVGTWFPSEVAWMHTFPIGQLPYHQTMLHSNICAREDEADILWVCFSFLNLPLNPGIPNLCVWHSHYPGELLNILCINISAPRGRFRRSRWLFFTCHMAQ